MSEINLMPGVNIAATGLAAQRARLEVIAQNIANASTTRGPNGEPYRRRTVELKPGSTMNIRIPMAEAPVTKTGLSTGQGEHIASRGLRLDKGLKVGVQVAGIVEDQSPFPMIYDPSHPDADAEGYVEMPNVDLLGEMVDLMLASRLYEANLAVLEASRENAKQTLDLMR